MRTGMTADDMASGTKLADLCGIQESTLPNPVRCDKEMRAPVEMAEQVGNVLMGAGTAVIEGKEQWATVTLLELMRRNGRLRRGRMYGFDVRLEIREFKFMDRGTAA